MYGVAVERRWREGENNQTFGGQSWAFAFLVWANSLHYLGLPTLEKPTPTRIILSRSLAGTAYSAKSPRSETRTRKHRKKKIRVLFQQGPVLTDLAFAVPRQHQISLIKLLYYLSLPMRS